MSTQTFLCLTGIICLSSVSECSADAGWLPAGDHIRTNFGPKDRDTFMVLILQVGGFRAESAAPVGKSTVYGRVQFTFEMNCTENCEMVFLSVSVAVLCWKFMPVCPVVSK